MDVRSMRNAVLGARVVNALKSRNMDAYYVETKEEAVAKALELMPKGSTISWGGTMSVAEAGLMDAIRNGDTCYMTEIRQRQQKREKNDASSIFADFFLGSTNAVSEDGVLVNIDGVANRVAAYAYGPKNVLLIVGMNKVVKTQRMLCTGQEMRRRRSMRSGFRKRRRVFRAEPVLTVRNRDVSVLRS